MKILCVCEYGSNRSVTMAHFLKHREGYETLTAGLIMNTPETLKMLFEWADKITVPEKSLLELIPEEYKSKVKFYDIGLDKFPRPYNRQLFEKARALLWADPI